MVQKRLADLSGRISREAWLQLQRARHHPNFADLMAHLESIEGQITEAHVEKAARKYLDNLEDQT